MSAQNEDPTPNKIPYCLINTNEYFIPDTSLQQHLQPIEDGGRGDKKESIDTLMERTDLNKLTWKTIARGSEPPEAGRKFGIINFNTSTHSCMINTGIDEMLVGDVIFALPAVPYLAKNNPSVNIFSYNGKTYTHPMLISYQEKVRLLTDLLLIQKDSNKTKTTTTIGSMIKNIITHIDEKDLLKLVSYLTIMHPIGKIEYSMEDNRQSVYNITPTKVSIGGQFLCLNNLFV